MRKTLIMLILILAVTLSGSTLYSQVNRNKELTENAQSKLDWFIGIGREILDRDGILLLSEEASAARVGEPVGIYSFSSFPAEELTGETDLAEIYNLLMWSFPIYVDDEPRGEINLIKIDGKWDFHGIGQITHEYGLALKAWPSDKGYRFDLLLIRGTNKLAVIRNHDEVNFYPITPSAARLLHVRRDDSGKYPLLETKYVKEKVNAALEFIDQNK